MDIKEINGILGRLKGRDSSTCISLLDFYNVKGKLVYNGKYPDLENIQSYECIPDGKGDPMYHLWHRRTYYDKSRDVVISECDSEQTEPSYYREYSYNKKDDTMRSNVIYTVDNPRILKYYKSCHYGYPYFEPINLGNELRIDSQLQIYFGDELVASVSDLVETISDPKGHGCETADVIALYELLTMPSICYDTLPIEYKDYMDSESEKKENQI